MPSRPLSTDRGRDGARRETAEVGAPQIVNPRTNKAFRPPPPARNKFWRRYQSTRVRLLPHASSRPSPAGVGPNPRAHHSPNECCIFTEGSNPRVVARTTRPRAALALDRSIDTLRLGFGPYTRSSTFFRRRAPTRARLLAGAARRPPSHSKSVARRARPGECLHIRYGIFARRGRSDVCSDRRVRARRPGLAPGWWAPATFIFRGADARSPRLPLPAAARRRAARRAVGSRQDSTGRRRARPAAAAAPSRRRSSTPRAVAGSTPETAARGTGAALANAAIAAAYALGSNAAASAAAWLTLLSAAGASPRWAWPPPAPAAAGAPLAPAQTPPGPGLSAPSAAAASAAADPISSPRWHSAAH